MQLESPSKKSVTAVRPRGDRTFDEVSRAMVDAGCAIGSEHVIPRQMSDAEAISRIIGFANPVLLVPFHARPDRDADGVDGLGLLDRLREQLGGGFPWRVVVTVAASERAAFGMRMVGHEVSPAVRRAVLVVHEEDVNDPGLQDRIASHVRGLRAADDDDLPLPETVRDGSGLLDRSVGAG
jgi:hypothetical protein